MTNGRFIVFEGLDRCGKTTIVNRLYERLSAITPTKKMRFPNRDTPVGALVDSYLKGNTKFEDETIHMLFACDRYENIKKIEDLRKNNILLCDRYYMSGIAFTASKGVDLDWCTSIESRLPKPDLTVFLDINFDEQSKRKDFGEEVYEKIEIQQKVLSMYRQLLEKEDNVFVVDAALPIDKIVEILMEKILN